MADGHDVIRVLVVDDHPVVRSGLRTFLGSRPGIEVVGEAADADGAVTEAARLDPDVVLMDLVLPGGGGVAATERLRSGRAAAERPRVLVLTSLAGNEQVVPAVRAGAAGYVLKDVTPDELEAAIRVVHGGGTLLAPQAAAAVVSGLDHPGGAPGVDELTARERDVLALLGRGMANRRIASELYVSEKTVKTHVSSILAKLRVADRTQAALVAARLGLDRAPSDDRPRSQG